MCLPIACQCHRKPEEAVRSPGTEVTEGVGCHVDAGSGTWPL